MVARATYSAQCLFSKHVMLPSWKGDQLIKKTKLWATIMVCKSAGGLFFLVTRLVTRMEPVFWSNSHLELHLTGLVLEMHRNTRNPLIFNLYLCCLALLLFDLV